MKPETGPTDALEGTRPAPLRNQERCHNAMPSNAMNDFRKAGLG
jgi:hypothetical protein